MTSQEILSKYLFFFKARGHKETPNVSLVPEGDSTLLFVNSGMFPLVPYLSGEPHPLGKKLVNVQRALRFDDLEEVGVSNRHTTCFHMLGNWSLGDYFKKEQLLWIYEFLVEVLGLDINRIYASVFEGDEYAPKDTESIEILKEIFSKYGIEAEDGERIFAYDRKENWWQRGEAVGELGGPDSEVFYYIGDNSTSDVNNKTSDVLNGLGKDPAENQHEFLEIGNSVFMQFYKTEDGWEELPQKNVDFGGGLERIALACQGKRDIFQTDNFWPIIRRIQGISRQTYGSSPEATRAMRILADNIRAASFIAMDGVIPSNKDQGYVLRRYVRRMVRFARKLGIEKDVTVSLVGTVAEMFEWLYPQLKEKQSGIEDLFSEEEVKFRETLNQAQHQVEKRLSRGREPFSVLPRTVLGKELAKLAFDLYQTLGYPPEIFLEDAQERGLNVDNKDYWSYYQAEFEKHQEGSRRGAEQKFKGGLADHSEEVIKYHTATHLLHYALRQVLGEHVIQRGSNITGERLRFDFSHSAKLTEEEVKQVEKIVNEKIQENLLVSFVMVSKEEAEKIDAIHAFGERYGDQVKVYHFGDSLENSFSKEFCGGPHVENTSQLQPIAIYKQESVGKGVRRVYAKFKSEN